MIAKSLSLLAVIGGLTAAGTARADVYTTNVYSEAPDPYSYAWNDPQLQSGIGVGVIVGGGVSGFTDRTMRNMVSNNVGGLWDARLSLGTHVPIGLDLSYVGTAMTLNAPLGTQNGTLVGTTAEAALRWNILPHFEWNPYIFAGIGYQRYDVTGTTFRQADTGIKDSDTLAVFPMGAGLSYRDLSGLVVDLRGTFRAATDSTLVLNQSTQSFTSLHTWEASAAIGYEF